MIFSLAALLVLAALNVLQLVFGFKERQKLLDRLQSRSLGEYKALESKEEKKQDREPPKRPEFI
jgi:hypothetical protein